MCGFMPSGKEVQTEVLIKALRALEGIRVKLRMEDPDRPGMAMGYTGLVGRIVGESTVPHVELLDQTGMHAYEIAEIDAVEIKGPKFA